MRYVVIDPGHGGTQSGGQNKDMGFKEKDIVLQVAKYTVRRLRREYPSIIPIMTRSVDKTLSLKKRCSIANERVKADLFLSIHTNAWHLPSKYGLEIETFYYRTSRKGKRFAQIIQKNLLDDVKCSIVTIDRGVKIGQRGGKDFYVLKYTNMPAALVELGFLSDNEEAMVLSKRVWQRVMGYALADSIKEYFDKQGNPSYDTDAAFKG